MRNSLKVRAAAAVLAAATFMPWYSSQARLDRDTYLGNPLPLIDWVVLFAALAVVVRPQLARIAAAAGLIAVALGGLLMWGDSAEGIHVSLEPGLPLAFVACLALLLFRSKPDCPNELRAERQDRPRSAP